MKAQSELSRFKLYYEAPLRGEGLERLLREVARSLQAGRLQLSQWRRKR